MKFKMNDVEYTIKEVSQQEFWDYQVDEQDGYYNWDSKISHRINRAKRIDKQ